MVCLIGLTWPGRRRSASGKRFAGFVLESVCCDGTSATKPETCGFPPFPPNHPTDEDLSVGAPASAERMGHGARLVGYSLRN